MLRSRFKHFSEVVEHRLEVWHRVKNSLPAADHELQIPKWSLRDASRERGADAGTLSSISVDASTIQPNLRAIDLWKSVRQGTDAQGAPIAVWNGSTGQIQSMGAPLSNNDDEQPGKSNGDQPLIPFDFVDFTTTHHPAARQLFWHSSAHILGAAMEDVYAERFPLLVNGPGLLETADGLGGGFYYDVHFENEPDAVVRQEDFPALQVAAEKLIGKKHGLPVEYLELTMQEAHELFSYNRFKEHFLRQIAVPNTSDEDLQPRISAYKIGSFIDLCRGPHLMSTKAIRSWMCTKNSAAVWMGEDTDHPNAPKSLSLSPDSSAEDTGASNTTLQRVYGMAWPTKEAGKEWLDRMEKAQQRDHRLLGRHLSLFHFSPYAPGSAFWLPHGTRLYNSLCTFLRETLRRSGYEEIRTPMVFDKKLWEISGHWSVYREDMFTVHEGGEPEREREREGEEGPTIRGLKPMNCPAHCVLYASDSRSYRQLPLRWADFSPLHRNEVTGALSGLTRGRLFHQDDAHIFCTPSQISTEIRECLSLLRYVYSSLGFPGDSYRLRLSTRPGEKERFGSEEQWEMAEEALRERLVETGLHWVENPGDGAFYGPKIDIAIRDSIGREHQCGTIQLDFQLPQRFQLSYLNSKGEKETPVIIHRAILGSVERLMAMLLENTGGRLPFWLSPRQIAVCPLSSTHSAYASQIHQALFSRGFHSELFAEDCTLQKKIRKAQVVQFNYMVIVGERERERETVALRNREGETTYGLSLEDVIRRFEAHMEKRD